MRKTVTVPAYAKINLGLRVLSKRPDGFHELRTVFQTISLADQLTITYARAARTQITIEGMPDVPDNLAARAARAVLTELRLKATVQIYIEKRIPLGAGLGGGSSDAAAVLLALPMLAGRVISAARLHALAVPLGSDVPFFLMGGTALGLGRGEELYPLADLPPLRGVLLVPGIHVSTPDAYRALSSTLADPERKLAAFQESVLHPLEQPLVNDFEKVVFAQHARLKALKQRLLKYGADQALMSGSGSSIFGLFHRKETVPGVVQSERGVGAVAISLLSRSRYRSVWNKCLKLNP
jgi:4-diphosphocytidyl-2-C-methyl-D-erythritol kinase